jgi:hypothetical protein
LITLMGFDASLNRHVPTFSGVGGAAATEVLASRRDKKIWMALRLFIGNTPKRRLSDTSDLQGTQGEDPVRDNPWEP